MKMEMRVKFNDEGESNGEFLFFFNDELVVHSTGLDVVPNASYYLSRHTLSLLDYRF